MQVEIRVRADQGADVAEARAPVAMVLVVDTSGSMAGRKIEDARQAAIALLDEMQSDDMVSVVRFASQAEVLVPLGRVGDVRIGSAPARSRSSAPRATPTSPTRSARPIARSDGRVTDASAASSS